MTRILIILLAVAMLGIWILFYLTPSTDYPYSPEHFQFGYAAMVRYFGFPF